MIRNFNYKALSVLLLLGLCLNLGLPGISSHAKQEREFSPASNSTERGLQANGIHKIEPALLDQLDTEGQGDFFVWMVEKADLTYAYSLKTKEEKGRYVFDALSSTADRAQARLRADLDKQGVSYQSFYIANKIFVFGGTESLVLNIAARSDVAKITANHYQKLPEPIKPVEVGEKVLAVEPNISFVNADDVWALGVTGSNTVMAGNDTGLDETHPAISSHYRGCLNPPSCTSWNHNYNWWDATGTYPLDPYDGHGHGTHTTGTMIGDDGAGNQIGMAPGAQTIHCKNMDDTGSGFDLWFETCFQWDLAPWDLSGSNPDPSRAPDAVNNSWGYGGGGATQFADEIAALQAAGILVEVSAGNEGPWCSTLRSPGDYEEVLTTGSVNHAFPAPGLLTDFSSRGPSVLYPGDYFPDIMAPGENIRSSLPGGWYDWWSGTSMAGPHTTALIGLMWSANPALRGQVQQTIQIIKDTASPLTGQFGSSCGGDYDIGPNNDWGYGTIDALAAVQKAIILGGAGSLDGTVTDDSTSLPIQGSKISALHALGYSWFNFTDASGYYTMTVAAGTYEVTVSHPQYVSQSVSAVGVVTDTLTTQNFQLTPRGRLFGNVTDFDNGFPLDATITADDGTVAHTDPTTGYYETYLDPGTHVITATAADYIPQTISIDLVSGSDTQQDFALLAAVSFLPSPLHVILPYNTTHQETATLQNRQPWEYTFSFKEQSPGFIPALNQPTVLSIPSGPDKAPINSAVSGGAYAARPASTLVINRIYTLASGPDVLLLHADDGDGEWIKSQLQAYGDLGLIDSYDARYSTPTLVDLLAYDIVLTWSNYVYMDPVGIGDVLADYVDAGGKVINLMFSMGTHGWNMSGRFINEK